MNSVSHYPREVFTPTLPAKLTFVERLAVDDKLVRAMQTPGKQIVVFGHSGAGKTTIVNNKLEQIFEFHVTTRCISGMTFDQIVLNGFDQLSPYYRSDVKTEVVSERKLSLQSEYKAIKAGIEFGLTNKEAATDARMLPPQLTPQLLAELMGEARACWVVEDFHKVGPEDKIKLAQTMKVFMDVADHFPDLKIIAIGAVGTGREVVQYDAEMAGRVAEVSVPLMDDSELRSIIDKGAALLGLNFGAAVISQILVLSSGLPAICHQICLNICFSLNLRETSAGGIDVTQGYLDEAIRLYIEDASDTLKERFDRASKARRKGRFDNGNIILKALCGFGPDGAVYGDLHKKIKRSKPDYPAGNLTLYLKELLSSERGEVICLDSASGKYSFADPFIRAYSHAKLVANSPVTSADIINRLIIQLHKSFRSSRS